MKWFISGTCTTNHFWILLACSETLLCAWTCGEHVQNVVVWDQGVRTPILHPPICEFICLLSICTGTARRRDWIWHSSLLAGQNYASQSPGDKKRSSESERVQSEFENQHV